MAAPSTPRAIKLDDDDHVYRMNDDEDDGDENAAPTKVGPMSKAFVDQLMFKAHLAESVPPSAKPASAPPVSTSRATVPPESGERARAANLAPGEIARFTDDAEVPQELTVLSDAAVPPEARQSPSLAQLLAEQVPAVNDAAPSERAVAAPSARPARSAPPLPAAARASAPPLPAAARASAPPLPAAARTSAPPVSSGPIASVPPASVAPFSAPPPASMPPVEAAPVSMPPPSMAPALPAAPYVEPSLSRNAARWMASTSVYPFQQEPKRDTRVVILVAVVAAGLLLATIGTVVWLFP